jgi:hypothetical protein
MSSGRSKQVCPSCINERYLANCIALKGSSGVCDYCKQVNPVLGIDVIAEKIKDGFNWKYVLLEGKNSQEKFDLDFIPHGTINFKDTFDLLMHETNIINAELLSDLSDILKYQCWFDNSGYEISQGQKDWYTWEYFTYIVKHERRYIFKDVEHPLGPVFAHKKASDILEGIFDFFREYNAYSVLRAGTKIYRGRKKSSFGPNEPKTAKELGAVPIEFCTQSNRYSPAGISMFYGATDRETCIAEINANEAVIIGIWELKEDIEILDLTQFKDDDVPSIFDTEHRDKRSEYEFILKFAADLRRTNNKTDEGEKSIEYVPTQIITEYLRTTEPPISGVCSYSSKNIGKNITLFLNHEDCIHGNKINFVKSEEAS